MRFACGLLLCAIQGGCGPQTSGDDGYEPPPEQARPYDVSAGIDYPAGPYGIEKGSVIADYALRGFPNPMRLPKELTTIRLSDFYNPTGDGVYPAGSPQAEGQPKPRALLIIVSAVWCAPCQMEAATTLPEKHEQVTPGGEFLLLLAESENVGSAADESDLEGWTNKFDTDFPAVIDPSHQLGQQFPQGAYPANMILDTKTMTVLEKITGAPEEDGSFWGTFAGVATQ